MDIPRLQNLMMDWMVTRFGLPVALNRKERTMRVLEEALELAQAEGVTWAAALLLLDHVFKKPAGEPEQEAAGIMVTMLAWFAITPSLSMEEVTVQEIGRIRNLPADHFRARHNKKASAGVAMEGIPPKEKSDG